MWVCSALHSWVTWLVPEVKSVSVTVLFEFERFNRSAPRVLFRFANNIHSFATLSPSSFFIHVIMKFSPFIFWSFGASTLFSLTVKADGASDGGDSFVSPGQKEQPSLALRADIADGNFAKANINRVPSHDAQSIMPTKAKDSVLGSSEDNAPAVASFLGRSLLEGPPQGMRQLVDGFHGDFKEDDFKEEEVMEIKTQRRAKKDMDTKSPTKTKRSKTSKKSKTEQPSEKPSVAPSASGMPSVGPSSGPTSLCETLPRADFIFNVIVAVSPEIFGNPFGPQALALFWLVDEDPAQIDPCTYPTLEQRYALVTMYFSTFGDDWNESSGWLTAAHECTWFGISCNGDQLAGIALGTCWTL